MTLEELREWITETSHRTNMPTARVDGFIRQAEGMIARDLRAVDMIETIELVGPVLPGIYELPPRILEVRAIMVGSDESQSNLPRSLKQVSLEAVRRRPIPSPPATYSIRGNRIEVRGHPGASQILTMDYFARPSALELPEDTNRLLENNPSIYLYGALTHLYIWTQDLELSQNAADTFQSTLVTLNAQTTRMLGGAEVAAAWNLENQPMGGGY